MTCTCYMNPWESSFKFLSYTLFASCNSRDWRWRWRSINLVLCSDRPSINKTSKSIHSIFPIITTTMKTFQTTIVSLVIASIVSVRAEVFRARILSDNVQAPDQKSECLNSASASDGADMWVYYFDWYTAVNDENNWNYLYIGVNVATLPTSFGVLMLKPSKVPLFNLYRMPQTAWLPVLTVSISFFWQLKYNFLTVL